MEKIGVELAKEGLDILRGTKAFVVDQAPDFMRQVLAWQMAESVLGLVVGVALFVIFGLIARRVVDEIKKDYEGNGAIQVFGGVLCVVLPLAGSIVVLQATATILKIHYAPKVFLLEYFAGLVK